MSHHFDLRDPLYRCVTERRAGGWPPLDVMQGEARWNPHGVGAIYAAFEPELAIREKLEHARMPIANALVNLLDLYTGGAVGGPIRLVVVRFDAFATNPRHVLDARGDADPRRAFRPHMQPGPHDGNPAGYDAPQTQGEAWARAGYLRLVVPSYPYFAQGQIAWTNVFYVGGYGQPDPSSLPALTQVGAAWDQWIPLEP